MLSVWCPTAKLSRIVIPNQAWSLKSTELPKLVHGSARISVKTKTIFTICGIHKHGWFRAANTPRARNDADRIVRRICYAAIDPDLRDEGESAPSLKVMQEAARLIRGAEKLLDAMPSAQVSTFFGEINITWRAGDRIVRLAVFESRPSVVQTGSLSNPIGRYESTANPTDLLLAEKLRELTL